ncbi:hypothetical protein FBY05_10732 [Pseudomonas sp. SJZ083]|nr:hypothetical protein FBY05_10732 [Pseudomonas sp. SJZ083]TWC48774.1 hypothetical protein FBY01_107232 [Pseudomonas sp. SJZ077]
MVNRSLTPTLVLSGQLNASETIYANSMDLLINWTLALSYNGDYP